MTTTVFRNVRVFPGHRSSLLPPKDVTVEGATIVSLVDHGPNATAPEGAVTVEGGGRTLMPGLIDAHWHAAFTSISPLEALLADPSFKTWLEANMTAIGLVILVLLGTLMLGTLMLGSGLAVLS